MRPTDQLKLEISIEIANALIDLHSGKFKVSYNDTTPMNILMNLDEKDPGCFELNKLALADFGISTVMKTSTYSHTQTNVTGFKGDRNYMAPQVLSQNKYYHIKTDVYRFGRLINHLFFNPKCLILEHEKMAKWNQTLEINSIISWKI